MKIKIYGLCNIYYDSFYIEGFANLFKNAKIIFDVNSFPNFKEGSFAVILEDEKSIKKIIIDSRDSNEIDSAQLEWCDVYGKVNVKSGESISKVVAIGPSFGIKIWNFPQTFFYGIKHFLTFNKAIKNKKEFLANYWRQYKRYSLVDYENKTLSSEKEVFFMGSLWKKEPATNAKRAAFIEAVKSNELIVFEGGFAPRNNNDNFGYDHLVVQKRYSFPEYMLKMKRSAIAFNTPAVLSCHGWKLGEFLALGKAVISNPHVNVLPESLEEGIHVLYAENSEELTKKINMILQDSKLKSALELSARNYFDNYLHPVKVIQRLVNHLPI